MLRPSAACHFSAFWTSNKVRQYNRIFSSNTENFKSCSVLRYVMSSNYKYTVPVSISCLCAQDYGYGSVRSAVSVSSSASHQKLENIDWNQQQGQRSERDSPERQKPSEQVSVCHSLTAQHSTAQRSAAQQTVLFEVDSNDPRKWRD